MSTDEEFIKIQCECKSIFTKKLVDYGLSWNIFRAKSMTDQIFTKILRIRSLEEKGVTRVGDSAIGEYEAIINYGIIEIILMENDCSEMSIPRAEELYEDISVLCFDLMANKNHDYGEAWRKIRVESITDLMYAKIMRIKQIEDNGVKYESEGIKSNIMDIINYAVFGLIRTL